MLQREFQEGTGIRSYSVVYDIANADYMSDDSVVNNREFMDKIRRSPVYLVSLLNRVSDKYEQMYADLSKDYAKQVSKTDAERFHVKQEQQRAAYVIHESENLRKRIREQEAEIAELRKVAEKYNAIKRALLCE